MIDCFWFFPKIYSSVYTRFETLQSFSNLKVQQSRGFSTARAALWEKKPDARRPLVAMLGQQIIDFGDMAELVDATDLKQFWAFFKKLKSESSQIQRIGWKIWNSEPNQMLGRLYCFAFAS